MRQIEAILTTEGEVEVVPRDAADRTSLEAFEAPDTVVFVDDDVARAQIAEGRDGATTASRRRAPGAKQR